MMDEWMDLINLIPTTIRHVFSSAGWIVLLSYFGFVKWLLISDLAPWIPSGWTHVSHRANSSAEIVSHAFIFPQCNYRQKSLLLLFEETSSCEASKWWGGFSERGCFNLMSRRCSRLDFWNETHQGENLWSLASLWLSLRNAQHVQRVPWLDQKWCRYYLL